MGSRQSTGKPSFYMACLFVFGHESVRARNLCW